MTPISLLTKSHSIRGMSDRSSPYKMTKLALPRFVPRGGPLRVEMEPAQQPWAAPLKIAEVTEIIEVKPIDRPAPEAPSIPLLEIPIVTERPPLPEPFPAPMLAPRFVKPPKAKAHKIWARRFKLFWKKLAAPKPKNPLAEKAVPTSAPAPVSQTVAQPAPPQPRIVKARAGIWELLLRRVTFRRRIVKVSGVQTELALEKVSVIRNDLSDAGLEVVPRMDAKKRGINPFHGAARSRRAKKAEEEKNAEPALIPTFGEAGKPTD